jgi:DNA-binding response OmpR family regulator
MMSLSPPERYQTASQLLEAIRDVRRELEGPAKAAESGPRSIFVLEKDQRLQDGLRKHLKDLGYRVLLSADPARALERYRQQPFDALIVDAGTVGEDGIFHFDRIMKEARERQRPCPGIVILSENQKDWTAKVQTRKNVSVLLLPVTVRQLHKELKELFAADEVGKMTEDG